MNIINKTVRHKTYGEGEICELRDDLIYIRFATEVKKFVFPDAFRNHLSLNEPQSRRYVNGILEQIDKAEKKLKEKEALEEERQKLLKRLPLNSNSQAAFGFFCNDPQKAVQSWTVSTGLFRTGDNCGQPRTPSRLLPNSACLLTYREKGDQEEKRYIWGAFMTKKDFMGSECSDGIIPAHEKFRIVLGESERRKFPFWEYVPCGSRGARWGSAEFKYFPNLTMAQILKDIAESKADTEQYRLCREFLDYFCELNKISARAVKPRGMPAPQENSF